VLNDMFAAAEAAGESHLDVSASALQKAVNGGGSSSAGAALCKRLMKRMMIPGDHDLTSVSGPHRTGLLIRFRLPRLGS
jgi:hypothetical protein